VLDCEQDSIELAIATIVAVELIELSHRVPSASLGLAIPPSSGAFKAVEDAMAVQINTEDPAKTTQIGAGLNPR
jgi:hypothetical protein